MSLNMGYGSMGLGSMFGIFIGFLSGGFLGQFMPCFNTDSSKLLSDAETKLSKVQSDYVALQYKYARLERVKSPDQSNLSNLLAQVKTELKSEREMRIKREAEFDNQSKKSQADWNKVRDQRDRALAACKKLTSTPTNVDQAAAAKNAPDEETAALRIDTLQKTIDCVADNFKLCVKPNDGEENTSYILRVAPLVPEINAYSKFLYFIFGIIGNSQAKNMNMLATLVSLHAQMVKTGPNTWEKYRETLKMKKTELTEDPSIRNKQMWNEMVKSFIEGRADKHSFEKLLTIGQKGLRKFQDALKPFRKA